MKTIFFLLALIVFGLNAREPYHVTITVSDVTAKVSEPNLVDLKRELKTTAIEELIPIYTPTSAVSLDFNFRGLLANTSFASNSTTLVVFIPNTNTAISFTGSTRDESIALFKEYIHDGGTHGNLFRAYAKHSPIDPIAGNPNSLMAQMAQADYLLGRLSPFSGCECSWSAQPIVHQFQAGTNLGRSFIDGYDAATITLPLRYSYSPNFFSAFIIDLPITYIRNGGASSLINSLGVALRYQFTYNWALTPTLRLGTGGSPDLCTSGCFFSAGINSVYNWKISEFVLSMTNYATYVTSTNLWLSGVNCNYHLQNYIFKNGISLNTCEGYSLCNRNLNFAISFIDSYFTGNRLFLTHYDEVGFTLYTTDINPCLAYDCLSLSFAYQFGNRKFRGYNLNMIYQF